MGILQKNTYKKTIEKDIVITVDNVIFKMFQQKSHFIKKVNFSIDNDLQYFSLKNHFLYWKNGFQKILGVKKKFSQQHESVSRSTPLSCCWENVKKYQNFTFGYFVKNSKNTIINRETVFTKFFQKTRTYEDFDENFQKFSGRLKVKKGVIFSSSSLFQRWN